MTKTAAPAAVPEDGMEVVGRTFAAALQEGLSRVSPPWAAAGPRAPGLPGLPGQPGRRTPLPASHAALLRDHREEILARLADALPATLAAAGHPDGRQTTAVLVDWARTLLAVAAAGAHQAGRAPRLSSLQLELTVATLLLECAFRALPEVPARDRALQTLGRALRGGR
ncbi:hypothetical protein ACWEGQ_38295 [Streptomyces seoulensis]